MIVMNVILLRDECHVPSGIGYNGSMSDQEKEILKPLNKNQRVFVEAYLKSWIASAAYKVAYTSARDNTARVNSTRLLAQANIRAEIEKRLSEMKMDTDEVLSRLASFARGSLQPFIRITDTGFAEFDFSHPDAKNNLHLIKKIKTKRKILVEGKGECAEAWEHEWVEVELHDPVHCLELIGKHKKLFEDKPLIPDQIRLIVEYETPKKEKSEIDD